MYHNFAANGSKDFGVIKGTAFSVAAAGTFGGGTITVQFSTNGTWRTFTTGTLGTQTAAFEVSLNNVGDSDTIRVNLAGATGANIDVSVNSILYK